MLIAAFPMSRDAQRRLSTARKLLKENFHGIKGWWKIKLKFDIFLLSCFENYVLKDGLLSGSTWRTSLRRCTDSQEMGPDCCTLHQQARTLTFICVFAAVLKLQFE